MILKTVLLVIALGISAGNISGQTQTLLRDNGIANGSPSEVLPQNAILHVQFNNPYRVIENIERLIVSTVPDRLVPPDMAQLMEMEHPVLTLLGMQTIQAPINEEQIGKITGLGAGRPITLTLYLGEPNKSFVLSIPVDNFDRFEGFLKQGLNPESYESASIGGKSFVRAKSQNLPPLFQQLVMAGSSDRVYISGSESLLMLLYSGASDAHLSGDPHMTRVFDATSTSDLWLTFNPNLLKPLLPQLEIFKYVPLNMLISKRDELLANIGNQERQIIEQRMRLQFGVKDLEELADYVECFASATYEEVVDVLVNGIRSFNGVSLSVKLDDSFPQLSYFLHSDQLQSDNTTRAIPMAEVREALSRIPGKHNHITIKGQTPAIVPSPRFTSWLNRLRAGFEAKELNLALVDAFEKLHLDALHPQPVSSLVPWTVETRTEVNPRTAIGEFNSFKEYSDAMSDFIGSPASRNVTIIPRQNHDLLEDSMRQRINAFEANNNLIKDTLLADQKQVQLVKKVYRLNSQELDGGVKKQTWETAFVSIGGLFGFNQHEFISRKVFYSRNVGDFSIFHQASRDARWISNLELLDTPSPNRGLEKLLDRVPEGASSVSIHRILQDLPYLVEGLAEFEALLHRDTDQYLNKARAIAAETADPEELKQKLESLKFSQLVYSLNRNSDSGDLYCLLPGGISYPRPTVTTHIVKLLKDFSQHSNDVGGLLTYTRVADGTLEGSVVQSTEGLSRLIKTVGNSIHEQILGDPGNIMELRDQIWTEQDRDSNRFEEIIIKNPTWEALPMPGQSGGWAQVREKTEAKLTTAIAARDSHASGNLIDLSAYYNASVNDSWHVGGLDGNDLSKIPQGIQELDGVKFDIRGIVQLTGKGAEEQLSVRFPSEVKNIKIDRNCEQMHVLHSVGWTETDGTQVGSLVIHYADGESREIPIIYGMHARDWWTPPNAPDVTSSEVGWKGENSASNESEMSLQLYKTTWPNPRPGELITSIDYVSNHTNAAPFLIAMTLD